MPPKSLVNWDEVPRHTPIMDREGIARYLPHRHEMALLDGIYCLDVEKRFIAGYKDVRADEFWARGHFPGFPLLPGVLILETAAQACTIIYVEICKDQRVLALAAVRDSSFRGQVTPPGRLDIAVHYTDEVPSKMKAQFHAQAYFKDRLVMDTKILGMPLPNTQRP